MHWIDFEGERPFLKFLAVQRDGRLSSDLASESEIDYAVERLKHEIDVAANRMKMVVQKRPGTLFGGRDPESPLDEEVVALIDTPVAAPKKRGDGRSGRGLAISAHDPKKKAPRSA